MAGSVNKVILIGNVGADPEVRQSADGRKIVNIRIATSDTWKDKNSGERRVKTEWHRVAIFNQRLASIAEQYVKKGSRLYIEGALQTKKYTDTSGIERYTTEIVLSDYRGEMTFLDGKGSSGDSSFGVVSEVFDAPASSSGWDSKPVSAGSFDDEIPF